MSGLLPPSASAFERALAAASARLGAAPVPLRDLWSPKRCPAALLAWLAWALSVDEWDEAWPEPTRRRVIATAGAVHRRKGTVWAVRLAMAAAGLGKAVIEERVSGHWARFRVVSTLRPGELVLDAASSDRATRFVDRYRPASRHLDSVAWKMGLADRTAAPTERASYTPVSVLRYDGSTRFDATRPYDGRKRGAEVVL